MGVSFFEKMQGTLLDPAGQGHVVELEVKSESARLRSFLREGKARLAGMVNVAGFADHRPALGTLAIDPRSITYSLDLLGDDGAPLTLWGRKDLDPLRALRSMTEMAAELRGADAVLARGTMRFDLATLPAFLGSWNPRHALTRVDLGGVPREPELPALPAIDAEERAVLFALGEALIVPGQRVPAFDARSMELAERLFPQLPPHLVFIIRQALQALDRLPWLSRKRRFHKLSVEDRREVLEKLGPAGEGLLYAAAMPVKAGHFARRDYLDAIGFPTWEAPPAEPDPGWVANVTRAEDLDADLALEADVVVLGTGAGGGPASTVLAERGLAVAILEEGAWHQRPAFGGGPEERLLRFWRDGGMNLTVGNVPIGVPTGRMVGGSTAINSGTCYRTPDAVLAEWRARGFPEDFEPERWKPWMDQVEAELQVEPAERAHIGEIGDIVARGADAMGVAHGPLRRNAPGCDGQGQCFVGCPTDAKRSSNVSWMPRAMKAGAALFTGFRATHLLRQGSRVVGVVGTGLDRHGRPRRLTVHARAVVVACGTLQSPLLLKDQGLSSPWLGRNLSIHPALGMFGLLDHPIAPWKAIPQGYGVSGLVDPRVRMEGFYAPPQLGAPTMPFWGRELTRWMDAQDRLAQFGFMVRDPNVGSVHRGYHGRPLIRYDLTPDTLDLLHRGAVALAELLLRGGAREVLTGIAGLPTARTVEEARALAGHPVRPLDLRIMAFHPLGTCRMGRDPSEGVVDFEGRVYGTDNLYVMDGSVVPTSLGVNPQVTIMGNAMRCAERLAVGLA